MPNYRRLFKPGGTSFFTVVTYKRQCLFNNYRARDFLRQCIEGVQKSHAFDMLGTVLLPDHIHCIWKLPAEESYFSTRWSIIKRNFSKMWLSSSGKEAEVSKSKLIWEMFEQFHNIMPKEWLEILLTIMEDQYHVTAILRAFTFAGRTQSYPETTQTPVKSRRLSTNTSSLFLIPAFESSANRRDS